MYSKQARPHQGLRRRVPGNMKLRQRIPHKGKGRRTPSYPTNEDSPLFAKQAKMKETLDRLQRTGIIAEVHKPKDWVQNLVVTEKKAGSMRICLDPRPLNKAIRREH